MLTFGERLEAAIKASGRKAAAVAREAGTTPENLSRIISGENSNPGYALVVNLARAARTTMGALNGESIEISREDLQALTQVRNWIDGKLATIDARTEPNAEILPEEELTLRELRVADRKPGPMPFGANFALRALGDSMNGAGIFAGDTLYAVRRRNTTVSALGRIIAFRLGDDVFVKRLTSRRRRHFLFSANPRYRPIEIAPNDPTFEILGIVLGRSGVIHLTSGS
ncbi:MAG TPA: LexA family transcriptional regulator [Thermoanaerobaculia bacterium]|nr:LexA family transcriptional regulator [Thermoanaerobaculia bacterium]